MRVLIVLLLSVAFFAACTKVEKEQVPYNDISFYKNVSESRFASSYLPSAVVMIGSGNGRGTGSFVSDDGVLVTNNHVLGNGNCFKEGCYIDLFFNYDKGKQATREEVYAVPLHGDAGADISVFQVLETDRGFDGLPVKTERKLSTPNYLKMTFEDPRNFVGQTLYTIGHPQVALKKVTELEILSTNGHDFEYNGATIYGQSGSPVMTADGLVVGLLKTSSITFTSFSNQGLNNVGGIVAAVELKPFFFQEASSFSLKSQVTPQVDQFTAIDEASVWQVYVSQFEAAGLPIGGKSLSDEESTVISDLERSCESEVENSKSGVSSWTRDCFLLVSLHRCKEENSIYGTSSTKEPYSDKYICATQEQREKWAQWMMTLFNTEAEQNGNIATWHLNNAVKMYRSNINKDEFYNKMSDHQPTLTFENLSQILRLKLNEGELLTYNQIDIANYFLDYRSQPDYHLYPTDIARAMKMLIDSSLVNQSYSTVLRQLYNDPKVSLSDRWRIESMLYNAGAL
ncbi:MAG: serine protease [Bdellovibrionales bacterium]|nr:serine protease [Bdellovibrionales bacterium]